MTWWRMWYSTLWKIASPLSGWYYTRTYQEYQEDNTRNLFTTSYSSGGHSFTEEVMGIQNDALIFTRSFEFGDRDDSDQLGVRLFCCQLNQRHLELIPTFLSQLTSLDILVHPVDQHADPVGPTNIASNVIAWGDSLLGHYFPQADPDRVQPPGIRPGRYMILILCQWKFYFIPPW